MLEAKEGTDSLPEPFLAQLMHSPAATRSPGSRLRLARSLRRRTPAFALIALLAHDAVFAQSPPIDEVWKGGTFNWTDPARWDPAGIPNDSGGATYNAVIRAAGSNVRLTQDIAIRSLTWEQGTVSRVGAGPFTLTVNDGLDSRGNSAKSLNGIRLVIDGHSVWTNAGDLNLTGASLENRGQLELWSDTDLAGSGSFLNAVGASFRKRGGTQVAQVGAFPGLPATNHGRVEVQSGTLRWLGSAVHHGTFQVAPGSTLVFGRGTNQLDGATPLDLPAGSTLVARDTSATLRLTPTGPLDLHGRIEVGPSGRVVADAVLRVAELGVDAGTLDGAGTVEVKSLFEWSPGTVAGPGTLRLGPDAKLSLSPPNGSRGLIQRTLELDNEVDWGSIPLNFGADATLIVRSNFTLQAGALFTAAAGQSARIRNEGFVGQRRGSSVITTQIGLAGGGTILFDNLGRLEVATNTLMLPHGGTHSGPFYVGSKATLLFGGHPRSLHWFHPGALLELPTTDGTLELRAGEFHFDSGQTDSQPGRLQLSDAHLVVHTGTRLVFGRLASSGSGVAVELDGGEFGCTGTGNLSGSLTGRGQMDGDLTTANLLIAPGSATDAAGQLILHGNTTFGTTTTLALELGGTTAGNEFDQLVGTGVVSLNNARLHVSFARGFQRTVTAADRFVVLRAASVRLAFANLPNNASSTARLYTEDGHGSFRLEYTPTEVVLSDFRADLAPAELEAWEPFDYPVSAPPAPPATLASKNGGSGFLGAWLPNAGIATEFQIADDSLPHPDFHRAGRHVALATPRSSYSLVQRPLQYRLGTADRTRYVSCLVRPLAPVSPAHFFGLLFLRATPASGAAPPHLFVGKPAGGANDHFVVEEAGGGGQRVASGPPLTAGQVYLLVVKLESAAGADRVSLFVDPVPGQPEPATANAVKEDFDVGVIPNIGLNSSGAWEVDELRIGSTWASVTRPASFRATLAIAEIPDPSVEEGTTLDLTPRLVESVAPRTVQWDLLAGPQGMTVDPDTGRIRWKTSESDGRPTGSSGFEVVVRVRDLPEPSSTATADFTVAVPELNSAPGLDGSSVGDTEVAPGESYHRDLRVSDPDLPANTFTFSLVQGPPGMTLAPAGGLDWTPPADQASGPVHVVVDVEDFNADAMRDARLRGRGFFDLNVVPRTDLRLTLTASPSAPPIAGQRGRYELKVENRGPAPAADIEVGFGSSVPFVPPATGLTITETSSSQAANPPSIEGDRWVVHLGDLAVGDEATVRMEMVFSFPQSYALTWEARSATAELRGQDNRVDIGVAVGTLPVDNPESWQFEPVEELGVTGSETVMEVNPSTGRPELAWFDLTERELRHAVRSGLGWNIRTVTRFEPGDTIGERGGLAMQLTPSGPRFAYGVTPAAGRRQIRFLPPQTGPTETEQIVYEPADRVGSLQFTGFPTLLPIVWFTDNDRLVQSERSVSSAGGWLSASYALPAGAAVHPSGRVLSVVRGSSVEGQHTAHLIVTHPDRSLEVVEARFPTATGIAFETLASLPPTRLPLYLHSTLSAGRTRVTYTTPDAGWIGADGDSYRLRIAFSEKTDGVWRHDPPLSTPFAVSGSCTRPVLLGDAQGVPRIVFTCTSQTADRPDALLDGDTGREYRRTWHVARRDAGSWTQEEIYASGEVALGFTREQQLTPLPHPIDPALAAGMDSDGVPIVAAHTGWPTENLVFGSLSPRWRTFPIDASATEAPLHPTVSLGRDDQPVFTWGETPQTGTYELHSARLRKSPIQFLKGPTTNAPGPSGPRTTTVGVDDALHVLVPESPGGDRLQEIVLAAGADAWTFARLPPEARSNFGDVGLLALPDGVAATVFDAQRRPSLFTRPRRLFTWAGLAPNGISPSGNPPLRVAFTGVDAALAQPALFVAYVPARPPNATDPFGVRVATFRDGQWTDAEVTTVAGNEPPLLEAKWLWHPPFEPAYLGYLYLAITTATDDQGRSQIRVLRRDLTRADSIWEDTRLEQVPADYLRDLRLEGHRESLRLAYLASGGRLYLASADLSYNFDNVRRAKVERIPVVGSVEDFDIASGPSGTWLAVTHDRRVEAVGTGSFPSFGGNETGTSRSSWPHPLLPPVLLLPYNCLLLTDSKEDRDLRERPIIAPTGKSRLLASVPPSRESLLYAVRDGMNRSPEGRRLVDLYYQHEGEARAVLWKNPSLGPSIVFLLSNFLPALRAWVDGHGDRATLTPGMIDQLNGIWNTLAAQGSAELKAALQSERARFHGFQDFVGKNMNDWAALLGLASTTADDSLHILGVQFTGAGVTLQVDAALDRPVYLERTASLNSGTWSVVPNSAEGTAAGRRTLTDPTPLPGAAYYRVGTGGVLRGSVP